MSRTQQLRLVLGIGLCVGLLGFGCSKEDPKVSTPTPTRAVDAPMAGGHPIDLPQVDPRLCTAVVLLIDTSASMQQPVPDRTGRSRPKHEIARDALARIVRYTSDWKTKHPDRVLHLGMYHFSSSVSAVLPISEFNAGRARTALRDIPFPSGGTAIGLALEEGFKALYQTGCVRKFAVCITDGENTSGPAPDLIARQLYAQTKGAVDIRFVAFDISARYFSFLKKVNGAVVEASNGAQLQTQLSEIYEKQVLAEAMPSEKK